MFMLFIKIDFECVLTKLSF